VVKSQFSTCSLFCICVNVCDQIKKNEMGGTCSTYGGQERSIKDFGGKTRGKETTWKTQA